MKQKIFYVLIGIFCLFIVSACNQEPIHSDLSEQHEISTASNGPLLESSFIEDSSDSTGEHNKYSGYLAGLVAAEKGCHVVALNPETKTAEKIVTLEDVPVGMPSALSPDGKMVAYANYIASETKDAHIGESMELFILNLETNQTKKVFNDPLGQQVETIRWLPDNRTLIFSMCIPAETYLDYLLYHYDTQTGELSLLDQGLTQTNITPEKIAAQEEKYQQSITVPYDVNSRFMFTTIKSPSISQDGRKILYVTSFNRYATPAFHKDTPYEEKPQLWLLSGIWSMDVEESEPPQLLYSNPDWRPNIGKAIWSWDGTEIFFNRYYDSIGNSDCGIEKLDLKTGTTKVLLEQTDEMRTNKVCAALENHKLLFSSQGVNGAHNFIMDTETGEYEPYDCTYLGDPFSLLGFQNIL